MTDPHPDRPTSGTDPVRDFFDRARRDVRDLPANPERWSEIVESAAPRHRWGAVAAAAAATVLLAGGLGWGLTNRGSSPTPAPVGQSTSARVTAPGPSRASGTPASGSPSSHPSGSAATSGRPTTGSSASASVPLGPVPVSFRTGSVTTASGKVLFSLGSVPCPTGQCPALAGSVDNGRTWRLVHTFAGWQTSTGGQGPQGATALTQVRFANPMVGWAFGGGVLRTTDGGRTWAPYPHPGGTVLALETDGTDVVLVAASSCGPGGCRGPVSIVRTPVTAASAGAVDGTLGAGSVTGATIGWHAGQAYVSAFGGAAPGPVVVDPSGVRPVGPACTVPGAVPSIVTPASGGDLFATCPAGGAAGTMAYAVWRSSDAGTTWRVVSTDALRLTDSGTVSVAAASGSDLIAASGGDPALHGSLVVSRDGGRTWAAPASAPPVPARGWAWLGAAGGSVYDALPYGAGAGYWKSADWGATWQLVQVAGSG